MFGAGIGIGIFFVTGSITVKMRIFFAMPSSEKLSDSTFVCASMFALKAGCGTGRFMSGPKYAVL
jgi:hypothetical protein